MESLSLYMGYESLASDDAGLFYYEEKWNLNIHKK